MTAPTRYVDATTVTDYFVAKYGAAPAAWSALSSAAKDRTTVEASEGLDHTFGDEWQGRRSEQEQLRDHPRRGMVDRDGFTIDATTTHQSVRDAACELCGIIAAGNFTSTPDYHDPGAVDAETISSSGQSIATRYAQPKLEDPSIAREYPKLRAMLRDVLQDGGGSGGTVPHI